jgi:predicted nucleic acid-binding Zn ribbon protein
MAKDKLTTCTSCGATISKGGKITCPNCGKVNKKPVYKRTWFIILFVIIALAAVGNLIGGDDDSVADSAQPNTEDVVSNSVEATKPDPIIITVDDLVDALDENALNASNTYKKAYVQMTGKLSNIDSSGDYFSLAPLNDPYSFSTIFCSIGKEHLDQVSNFKKDQEVTVIGTITDVGEVMGYYLEVETIK